MKYTALTLLIGFIYFQAVAQHSMQGYISDEKTGEKLIGCSVHISGTTEGVTSNNYGFYSIKINKLPASVVFSYIGYKTDTVEFVPAGNNIDVMLSQKTSNLKEVEIRATSAVTSTPRTGVLTIPVQQIKQLPALGGEVDVMKAFQLMPGVQGGSEGTSGLYVRGGTPDQNLILLDDIPLYYVNHIGGFISVFDVNAINDIKLIKGGFPARYGGRLSSVVDIRMKTGNSSEIKGEYGIGLLASRIFIEGPVLKKKKTKFMFSLRRCNLDIATRLITRMQSGLVFSAGYTFYDLYSKITHEIDSDNSISFSFYNGRDNIFFKQRDPVAAGSDTFFDYQANIIWGNTLASVKWNHQYNKNVFGTLTFAYTHFKYLNRVQYEQKYKSDKEVIEKASTSFVSGVNDVILKKDFDYFVSNTISLKMGAGYTNHQFNPGVHTFRSFSVDSAAGSRSLYSNEITAYVESEFPITKNINTNAGLHFNTYFVDKSIYPSLQPRITVNYNMKPNWSVKSSFVYMQQNLHLLSNNGAGLPTDLWVPATSTTSPQYSYLYSIGLFHTLDKKGVELSIEGYYKSLDNQIEFSEGASFFGGTNDWEDKIERNGKGRVYGVEFLAQKDHGRLTGWIGYTLSYNYRKFDNINKGKWFPYKFDRRHYFTIAANYALKKNIIFSGDLVFNTGNAITLPDGKYPTINGEFTQGTFPSPSPVFTQVYDNTYTYSGRNQSRMPVYHRIDLAVRFIKERKKGTREWVISVYNIYSRQNPYFIYMQHDKQKKLHLYQITLFPIIPSFTYVRTF
jgi:hypothetical protein